MTGQDYVNLELKGKTVKSTKYFLVIRLDDTNISQ